MRREEKAGPFIPCEVRAQMGPARATTHAPMQRRVPHGRGVFSQTPQTSAQPVDDVYV